MLLAAAGGASYLIGFNTADDADQVAELEENVERLSEARDDERVRADAAEDEVARLEERLDAELGFKDGGGGGQAGQTPADADLRMGEAGRVGDLILRPTEFVRAGTSGDRATYVATISVKNDGSEPAGPFCGGSGAELEDSQGRVFDSDSVIADNTANCGDDIQPGLTADNFKVRFRLPSEAEPALLRLFDDFDETENKTWATP